ncbi:hypothetical protein L211DRAFT_845643 [Terfezia boudieri ATCC MYA-4762]|uniref:Uncharacterized protein n=1 Tax=Terfezia boudieri ATCC MYA-4762 TaxID=1051890 RepID=A0A3N4M3S1_9PEZI|nr:hypothetical protein L211DRAFT_845643 [Terfezia boudieri ATCC MYA-4762]
MIGSGLMLKLELANVANKANLVKHSRCFNRRSNAYDQRYAFAKSLDDYFLLEREKKNQGRQEEEEEEEEDEEDEGDFKISNGCLRFTSSDRQSQPTGLFFRSNGFGGLKISLKLIFVIAMSLRNICLSHP